LVLEAKLADSLVRGGAKYTAMVMALTPIGVFGAMAHDVSHMASGQGDSGLQGWTAVAFLLKHYSLLVGSLYLALALLVLLVFLPVMVLFRIPILGFLRHIREPALMAFSTASSEAALPKLLEQMEKLGVRRRVASFVIPTGYRSTWTARRSTSCSPRSRLPRRRRAR
jgi:Na+/H+-dicarboxylate symporter